MSMTKEAENIKDFLAETLQSTGANGYVLGMSGGIDSAVVAALAKRAVDELNAELKVPCYTLKLIMLPMGNVEADVMVATEVAQFLNNDIGAAHLEDALSYFLHALEPYEDPNAKVIGNVKARLRMTALYYLANRDNLLVLGTDNLSETYTGYFTKHGDGAADVFPISDYVKRDVYALGRYLKLPDSVLSREPSAGLWDGQTDEAEMGFPYNFVDNTIEGLDHLNRETYGSQYSGYAYKLAKQHESTEHKRAAPHVYKRNK